MAGRVALFLGSLGLCTAVCLSNQVRLINNPTHNAYLDPPYIPTSAPNGPRLFVIGDVHGMRTALEELLETAGFSQTRGDRLIFAGDMVNKGPDSAGVVAIGMALNASNVRGNHEDRILRTWAGVEVARYTALRAGGDGDKAVLDYEAKLTVDERDALATARSMTPEQRAYSAASPVTIRLGSLPGWGETAVVHAGLAPGVKIESQEPWAMYNVRSLLHLTSEGRFATDAHAAAFNTSIVSKMTDTRPGVKSADSEVAAERQNSLALYNVTGAGAIPISTNVGRWWVESWNEAEAAKAQDKTLRLIYGHDSNRGLQLKNFTYGLDSKCVDGGKLTALILEPKEGDDDLSLQHRAVSVQCENFTGGR